MNQFPPNTAIATYYTEISHKYQLKGIFYLDLWPFGPSQMVLVHPNAAEHVTTVENYPLHDEVSRYLTPLLGEHAIGASDGERWKMLHRILTPAFKPSKTKAMAPVIAEQVSLLLHPTLTQYAGSAEVFSMEECAARLVFSISSTVILGNSVSEDENAQLISDINAVVDYATMLTLTAATNPLSKVRKWWKKRAAIQRMDSFLRLLIKGRYAQLAHGKVDVNRADSTILDAILANVQSMRCVPHGFAAPDSELVQIVTDKSAAWRLWNNSGYFMCKSRNKLYIGSSANPIEYVFIVLHFHPPVVQNLRDEHDRIFSRDINAIRKVLEQTPHKLNELHYTTAVVKETLRLFPVGFGAQIFPHPTKFNPARFLEPDLASMPRNAWRPFERGARMCPGRDLAMDGLRIILLLTVREYKFQCADVDHLVKSMPGVQHTDMDAVMGDLAFQEMGFSAKARGGAMMRVSLMQSY
ncbi:predicted protein [Aspergillus terreus NIH2624]|uniref:Cytochrome P450 n=1 Tax=Aspergillus terreus (strain NIH 2624 / FGSC A1156) TaxID=341663 RepID=Q0CCV8_ASPTN|nr:uncharacterized protein ATEG_08476 [Aspergillus terreus NIH2624]EAU31649.1 predicted protein [Aspergillus terreus NIH2624]